jgi:hypothetical protein
VAGPLIDIVAFGLIEIIMSPFSIHSGVLTFSSWDKEKFINNMTHAEVKILNLLSK